MQCVQDDLLLCLDAQSSLILTIISSVDRYNGFVQDGATVNKVVTHLEYSCEAVIFHCERVRGTQAPNFTKSLFRCLQMLKTHHVLNISQLMSILKNLNRSFHLIHVS